MVDSQHPTDWLSSSKTASTDGKQSWTRRHKTGLGLAFAGVVAGGVLAGTLGASAATGGAPAGEGSGYGMGYGMEGGHGAPPAGREGGPRPPRANEKPLSASLTASLKAKALAAVPGGTVERVETGHGGAAYEAHVKKADGTRVRVTFDKNQKVLAIETDMGKGGPRNGGPKAGPNGGPGGHPGAGPEGGVPPAGGPEGGGPRGRPPVANPES
jgi:hypothetical protein